MSTLVWTIAGGFAASDRRARRPVPDRCRYRARAGLRCRAPAARPGGRTHRRDGVAAARARSAGSRSASLEAVLYTNVINTPSLISMVLFVLVLVLVLVRGKAARRDDSRRRAVVVRAPHQAHPRERCGTCGGCVTCRASPAPSLPSSCWSIAPVVITLASSQFLYSRVLLFALVALSLTVLTGWAGQLSLGQFGFVGLGAFTTAALHTAGVPFGFGDPRRRRGRDVGRRGGRASPRCASRASSWRSPPSRSRSPPNSGCSPARCSSGTAPPRILPRCRTSARSTCTPQRTYYYLCLAALVLTVVVVVTGCATAASGAR